MPRESKFNSDHIDELLEELFPICRSLTGEGNRTTLTRLSEVTPLEIQEIASGTPVYDWKVPPEWNINEAYIKDSDGKKVVSFDDNNLHVVSYSEPIDQTISFERLQEHMYTLPDMPETIPYRTTYYERDWGFCLRQSTFNQLDPDEMYEVYIDSELDNDGSLTYADATIEGTSDKEYIISTYCCHPSMANDNLSGLILAVLLFEKLRQTDTYHSYRLIIVPETIGSVAYLHRNEENMKDVDGGFVLTTVGGPGTFDYKESFRGDAVVDVATRRALAEYEYEEYEFVPDGSDERQYSSPGFRIPTVTIAKDKYYEYDEYHTSDDDLSLVSGESIKESFDVYWRAIQLLEMNRTYVRTEPYCEFKLDQYDLYPTTGGMQKQSGYVGDEAGSTVKYELKPEKVATGKTLDAIRWLMFGCDGQKTLLDLSERSDMSLPTLFNAAEKLEAASLLTVEEL